MERANNFCFGIMGMFYFCIFLRILSKVRFFSRLKGQVLSGFTEKKSLVEKERDGESG